jgi:hypothetical protein
MNDGENKMDKKSNEKTTWQIETNMERQTKHGLHREKLSFSTDQL